MVGFETFFLFIIARMSAKIVNFALSIGNRHRHGQNDRHTSARYPTPYGGVALCRAVCRMPVRRLAAKRGMA